METDVDVTEVIVCHALNKPDKQNNILVKRYAHKIDKQYLFNLTMTDHIFDHLLAS